MRRGGSALTLNPIEPEHNAPGERLFPTLPTVSGTLSSGTALPGRERPDWEGVTHPTVSGKLSSGAAGGDPTGRERPAWEGATRLGGSDPPGRKRPDWKGDSLHMQLAN